MNPDPEIERQLQAELDPGEQIVWQGRPRPAFFTVRNLLPMGFVVVWISIVGIVMFSGVSSTHSRSNHAPPFFFLPFILVAVFFVIQIAAQNGSFFKTHYLVTNRRALIVTLGRNKRVASYLPGNLQSLERREKADGSGDLIIEKSPLGNYSYQTRTVYGRDIGFMNIPDVKTVEGLLRDLATKRP